jgi:hypothetical protein
MQACTKLYTNFDLFITYGRIVSRAYEHYQSSCLLTLHWFFLNLIVLFKNHPAVVLHSRNLTHPWNNSMIQNFPGAQIGSARPTTWPPRSQTFLSVYTKKHIHCITLLGTLHILSAGIINCCYNKDCPCSSYAGTPLETGECSGRHLIQRPSLYTYRLIYF